MTDEVKQKLSELSQGVSNLSYPLTWKSNSNFLVEDRKITKLHGDSYRKMTSQWPLQGSDCYNFKLRVITMGTIAMGIVPEENKEGYFIDSRTKEVFKFVAFENGGSGVINFDKKEFKRGKSLSLQQGDIVELTLESKTMIASLRKSSLVDEVKINLKSFKGSKLYFFLEMKQKGTCIEFY